MLQFILVETQMFGPGENNVEQTRKDLCWWLEALTNRNQDYLAQHPETPSLYKSGVKYEAPKQFGGEPEEVAVLRKALGSAVKDRDVAKVLDTMSKVFGGEHFCDIGTIMRLGGIDCDGMACWRAAELRQAGIPAIPFMTHRERPGGGTTYHALVRWPPFASVTYWTDEDPSLILGMGGAARAADRQREIDKNKERCELIAAAGGASAVTLPPASGGGDLDNALKEILGHGHGGHGHGGRGGGIGPREILLWPGDDGEVDEITELEIDLVGKTKDSARTA